MSQFSNSVCNLTVVDDGSTCLPFISGKLLKAFFVLRMCGPAKQIEVTGINE